MRLLSISLALATSLSPVFAGALRDRDIFSGQPGDQLYTPLEIVLASTRTENILLDVVGGEETNTRSGLTTTGTADYPGEKLGPNGEYQVFGKIPFSQIPKKDQEIWVRSNDGPKSTKPGHGAINIQCFLNFKVAPQVKQLNWIMPERILTVEGEGTFQGWDSWTFNCTGDLPADL